MHGRERKVVLTGLVAEGPQQLADANVSCSLSVKNEGVRLVVDDEDDVRAVKQRAELHRCRHSAERLAVLNRPALVLAFCVAIG
jgi:hypothetical protein